MIQQVLALVLGGVLTVASQPVLHLQDGRLGESSSLVDLGATMVSANDSGHEPLIFVIDSRTGATLGTTRYAATQIDTEAMAPAGRASVWVGDIGDNLSRRSDVTVLRVPVRAGDHVVAAPAYRLTYPDGAHDAESLFVGGGRLYVVTKAFFGAGVYVAPRHLSTSGTNRLTRVASAPAIVTDAAMFRDGRHLIMRNYAMAFVFAFPSFRRLGGFALPAQPQGESISVGPGGRIRIGSEGVHSAVLQIELPGSIRRAMQPATSQPTPTPAPAPATRSSSAARGHHASWPGLVAGGLLILVLLTWSLRRRTLRR